MTDRLTELEATISRCVDALWSVSMMGATAKGCRDDSRAALAELVEIARKQETALQRIAAGCVVQRYDVSSQTYVVIEGLDVLQIARTALVAASPPEVASP